MSDDFLRRLQAAASDEERQWLATERLLNALSADLRRMAWAAAVPHWFNADILAALRPELRERAADLYAQLQVLPFVEPFAGRGHNVHELTRRLMLQRLWEERREEYVELSRRAAGYFGGLAHPARNVSLAKLLTQLVGEKDLQTPDPRLQVEHIYHLLLADPDQGAEAVAQQGAAWHDEPDYTFSNLKALARAAREHTDAGRCAGRAAGWGRYWEGLIAYYAYQYPEAVAAFQDIQAAQIDDNRLSANCIQRLGDVHTRLSELPQARARYEEVLPFYRAIGEKLGEANCIRRLGDVHTRLSELPQARARYEEALPIYRAIGEKLGEANCISSLGDIAVEQKDFDAALQLYQEAIALRRAISPADEASGYNALGNMYEKQKEYDKAIQAYSTALELFPDHTYIWRNRADMYLKMKDAVHAAHDIEQAARLQPDNAYLFLRRGQLAILQGQYDEALAHLQAALERYPRMNAAHFNVGLAHLRAGQAAQALEAYRQGLAVTDAPPELDDALEDLAELGPEAEAARQMIQEWIESRKGASR